jgi:hypothetical protein
MQVSAQYVRHDQATDKAVIFFENKDEQTTEVRSYSSAEIRNHFGMFTGNWQEALIMILFEDQETFDVMMTGPIDSRVGRIAEIDI